MVPRAMLAFYALPSVLVFATPIEINRKHHDQCVAARGQDTPSKPYAYPVSDSEACHCSVWNPAEAPSQWWSRVWLRTVSRSEGTKCERHHQIRGAPWGLVFFGMSLMQNVDSPAANKASVMHQSKFDLDRLQDRGFEFMCKTNDDGWLAGGGNAASSFMLPNMDSAHIELLHLATICGSLASSSKIQPDTSSYTQPPMFVTGAPLAELVDRVRSKLAFDPIRLVPTGSDYTPVDEYQLRFNPKFSDTGNDANPTLTAVYHKLVNLFLDVQSLEAGDPFHVSMCRETKFCGENARKAFQTQNLKLTIDPWQRWAKQQNGTILNDMIPQYKDKAGGFYLFVTRNRPLIYFAPAFPFVAAYYVEWEQDGKVIDFASPLGGAVKETLVQIPQNVTAEKFISQNAILTGFASGLCEGYSFNPMPTGVWEPPSEAERT